MGKLQKQTSSLEISTDFYDEIRFFPLLVDPLVFQHKKNSRIG
jgi:hypothetical protein